MSMTYICPQCGEETYTLHEGYCKDCRNENQAELDSFNEAFGRWERLTDSERWAEIRRAAREEAT